MNAAEIYDKTFRTVREQFRIADATLLKFNIIYTSFMVIQNQTYEPQKQYQ
jgi:hypothetical protein